jgi:hypothetical protein
MKAGRVPVPGWMGSRAPAAPLYNKPNPRLTFRR